MSTPPMPPLQDTIHIKSTASQPNSSSTKYLIFIIPGNPGIAEYYRPFLTHLSASLSSSPRTKDASIDVLCTSMAGFEVASPKRLRPYGLTEQISFAEGKLTQAVREAEREGRETVKVKVVLVGHSVGSYILMEVVRLVRERFSEKGGWGVEVVGGICLFPTVVDIGLSEKGVNMTRAAKIPYLAVILGLLVRVVMLFVPVGLLARVGRMKKGMSGHNAYVTAWWLKTNGLWQALHMGFDEMREITVDKWDEDVWGAAGPSESGRERTKLFFYFGKDDHWVADHTRDDLIRLRGRVGENDEWKPVMDIDQTGIPHAFVMEDSEPVAEKVREYVEGIIDITGSK